MSGSELAPLVAAALRDKVVLDMQKEIEELKRQRHSVEIVVDGSVFAVGNLKEESDFSTHGSYFIVNLNSQKPCRLANISKLSVSFAGTPPIVVQEDFCDKEYRDWDADKEDNEGDRVGARELEVYDLVTDFGFFVKVEGVSDPNFEQHRGEDDDIDVDSMLLDLPDNVASNATFSISKVYAPVTAMEGFMKGLLPPEDHRRIFYSALCRVRELLQNFGNLYTEDCHRRNILRTLASKCWMYKRESAYDDIIKGIVQLYHESLQNTGAEPGAHELEQMGKAYILSFFVKEQVHGCGTVIQEDADSIVKDVLAVLASLDVSELVLDSGDDSRDPRNDIKRVVILLHGAIQGGTSKLKEGSVAALVINCGWGAIKDSLRLLARESIQDFIQERARTGRRREDLNASNIPSMVGSAFRNTLDKALQAACQTPDKPEHAAAVLEILKNLDTKQIELLFETYDYLITACIDDIGMDEDVSIDGDKPKDEYTKESGTKRKSDELGKD